jgi:DNA-binding response OmpR family regulator
MSGTAGARRPTRAVVIADVESNAQALIDRVLAPAGIQAWTSSQKAPPPDVLVVDLTQLRGDPLAGLRAWRETGDKAPAVVLASLFPAARLRDLFRLGASDVLLKPYRPLELCKAVLELAESRSNDLSLEATAGKLEAMQEQFKRRSEELRLLTEIGRVVVNLGELDAILTRVVEAAAFVTEAEEANIYLAEPDTQELVLRASKQAGQHHATLKRLRVRDTLVGQVFRTGQPVLRQPSLEGGPLSVQTGFLVQSLIKVPLRQHKKIVGVLGVYNRLNRRSFSDHQLTVLTALADWAGVALERATLLRRNESARRPDSALTAVPVQMINTLDNATTGLQSLMDGELGELRGEQLDKLRAVHHDLELMRSMPVVMIDQSEAERLLDLPAIVRAVAEEHHQLGARRGISIEVEPSSPVPLFPGDRRRVQQVVAALVLSALHRTQQGRVLLRAERFDVVRGRGNGFRIPRNLVLEDGPWASVTVSDSSLGLSPDTRRSIEAESADPADGKTGPGLSFGEIRMIAESLGGVLWHDQTADGPSITFAFPAV